MIMNVGLFPCNKGACLWINIYIILLYANFLHLCLFLFVLWHFSTDFWLNWLTHLTFRERTSSLVKPENVHSLAFPEEWVTCPLIPNRFKTLKQGCLCAKLHITHIQTVLMCWGFSIPMEVQGGEKTHHKHFTWGITVNGSVFKDFAMCLCRNV